MALPIGDSGLAKAAVIALPLGLLYVFYTYIVYPLFLSPLRNIPTAHWSCAVSSIWIDYQRRGFAQAVELLRAAHERHGPIIRLSPYEVSVSSMEAAKKVYIERGGYPKPKWWAAFFSTYGVINGSSMIGGHGDKMHAVRKRDHGNVYSKSTVVSSDEVKTLGKELLPDLLAIIDSKVAKEEGVLDMFKPNGAVGVDFTSAYIYGRPSGTHFLRDLSAGVHWFRHADNWFKQRGGPTEAKESLKWMEGWGLRSANGSEKEATLEKGLAPVQRQLSSRGLAGKDLASELLDHVLAGAEGPRVVLTYLEWELSRNPSIQSRLRKELPRDIDTIASDIKALDSLPMLEAVLVETMRCHTPFPGAMYREAPAEGTTLHDYFIPGGTQISASLGIFHYNRDVFEKPEEWNPDRWLTGDQEKLSMMRNWFWAFSKGSRTCTGKDFILIVMKMAIAAIYSQYCTRVVDDSGMEPEDHVSAAPVGESLVLKFERVQE
ncbi:cytochrome P450 [Sporormia fimetaria CBS 119925]|uniref:Cytochrome P450 n=1 Tax=Sporormia fimetaria CBS 119925 TaxID=1340428 RepID=A0A6A6VL08_9PLEO|nr:cytochrome P450 [Sporormia fimetaria CBS 119925]